MPRINKVIVVGAGPCGLLLAILLAQVGIKVEVLDKEPQLDDAPRAAYYNGPSMRVLARAGLLPDIEAEAFYATNIAWRNQAGERLFGFNNDVEHEKALAAAGTPRSAVLPLRELLIIIYKHARRLENVSIQFNKNVTAIKQDDEKASVTVSLPGGSTEQHDGDFAVGCDGANSIVRRSLFGDWEFPGFTWDQTLVATNVHYDFYKYGFSDVNNVIDPESPFLAAKITKDGLFRVTYGDKPGLTNEEYLERLPMKFESILPGNPKPGDYKLLSARPYRCHQRLSKLMRVGRFLLVGDAAHLTNPFGGLGLTNGICDVGSLADCLAAIHEGKASHGILDKFDEVRRRIYEEFVNPTATRNMKLVFSTPEEAVNSEIAQVCNRAEKDPEFAKSMSSVFEILQYDFSNDFDLVDQRKSV